MSKEIREKRFLIKIAQRTIRSTAEAKNYEKNTRSVLENATIIVAKILSCANYSEDQIQKMPIDERLSAAILIILQQIDLIKNSPE